MKMYETHVQTGLLLNANEASYNVSDDILNEIKDMLSEVAFNRYPDESDDTLLETYAQVMGLDASQLMAGNGSDQMLGFLIGSFLGKGKTLYTWNPDFSMYDYYASSYDASILKYDVAMNGSFDLDDFIQKGKENHVDMVMFSNPNNPTGHCLYADEVIRIVEAFGDIPVVVDEAYMEFSDRSVLDKIEDYSNLYVCRTMSKAYGMAGIRLGFLACSKENMSKLRPYGVPYALNTITQKIGTIVLRHADEYKEKIAETKRVRNEYFEVLSQFKTMTFYPSQANFIRGVVSKNKDRLRTLFTEADIIIRDYPNDTFRLTVGTPEENARVLEVLNQFEKENLV